MIVKNGVRMVFGFQPIKFESYYVIYFRSVKNICVKITKRRLIIIEYCELFEYESKCSLSNSSVTQELLFQILPFQINQTDHECISKHFGLCVRYGNPLESRTRVRQY
jgi:hypothetical protein